MARRPILTWRRSPARRRKNAKARRCPKVVSYRSASAASPSDERQMAPRLAELPLAGDLSQDRRAGGPQSFAEADARAAIEPRKRRTPHCRCRMLCNKRLQMLQSIANCAAGERKCPRLRALARICCDFKRRAGDSNPQPLTGHLISSQAAGQFAYPPERLNLSAAGPLGNAGAVMDFEGENGRYCRSPRSVVGAAMGPLRGRDRN